MENGDLRFSGEDLGKAPKEYLGDSDYEYWLTIPSDQKDQVLLALIEKHYSNKSSVISEFKDFLDSKEIPSEFYAY